MCAATTNRNAATPRSLSIDRLPFWPLNFASTFGLEYARARARAHWLRPKRNVSTRRDRWRGHKSEFLVERAERGREDRNRSRCGRIYLESSKGSSGPHQSSWLSLFRFVIISPCHSYRGPDMSWNAWVSIAWTSLLQHHGTVLPALAWHSMVLLG